MAASLLIKPSPKATKSSASTASTSSSTHRRTLSSGTDAASSLKSEEGSFPLLSLPKKLHRRIGSSGANSKHLNANTPSTTHQPPPPRPASESNEALPPKLPRKSSRGSDKVGSHGHAQAVTSSSAASVSSASQHGSVGFVSTPTGTSVSSQDHGRHARRSRADYANDEAYAPIRRIVSELNRAMGPDQRRAALNHARSSCVFLSDGTASLYLGAADALTLLLSMSDDDTEIGLIVSCLEMVYQGACKESIVHSYREVGPALVPLCLRLLEQCDECKRGVDGTLEDISKVLLYMTRISELRVSLVGHTGLLGALERVGNVNLVENRVLRMRILANLANSESNKSIIFERLPLLESVLKVATFDKSESVREYASAVLMDLASCPTNQVRMAQIDQVLGTFVKLAVVETKVETREFAVSGLQNLAFEKRNRVQLVTYRKGVVVEALKKTICSDSNEKTRRRSAGALTNLACDDTAEKMGCHDGLLQTLSKVSLSDSNKDVRQRATLALTKLANSVTIEMSCWSQLLDALIDASRYTVADGIVSAMFRVKTRAEENRISMASHPRLVETLARLCLVSQEYPDKPECIKDCENATKALAHLANEPSNHKLICSKRVLAALVHSASLPQSQAVTRDAAILAMERMAMEHSNRPMMARYPGMLVTIAQATEREMKEEVSGMQLVSGTGQPRLAKPLLMSLLVAM